MTNQDETYFDWERGYKWAAHERWNELLNPTQFAALLKQRAYREVAARGFTWEQHQGCRTTLRTAGQVQTGCFGKISEEDIVKNGLHISR
jgi:hypothetical protein